MRVIRACGRWHLARPGLLWRPTLPRCTCVWQTRLSARPGPFRRELPENRARRRGRACVRRGGRPPRLRVPRGERRVRARGGGGGADLHRPDARGGGVDGVEDERAARGHRRRGAGRAGDDRAASVARRSARDIGAARLPRDAQGGGGRRRQGHAPRRVGIRFNIRVRDGAVRGRFGLRRLVRLPRKSRRAAPSHRDTDFLRHARQLRAPRRARVLDSAPPPEGDRRVPFAD